MSDIERNVCYCLQEIVYDWVTILKKIEDMSGQVNADIRSFNSFRDHITIDFNFKKTIERCDMFQHNAEEDLRNINIFNSYYQEMRYEFWEHPVMSSLTDEGVMSSLMSYDDLTDKEKNVFSVIRKLISDCFPDLIEDTGEKIKILSKTISAFLIQIIKLKKFLTDRRKHDSEPERFVEYRGCLYYTDFADCRKRHSGTVSNNERPESHDPDDCGAPSQFILTTVKNAQNVTVSDNTKTESRDPDDYDTASNFVRLAMRKALYETNDAIISQKRAAYNGQSRRYSKDYEEILSLFSKRFETVIDSWYVFKDIRAIQEFTKDEQTIITRFGSISSDDFKKYLSGFDVPVLCNEYMNEHSSNPDPGGKFVKYMLRLMKCFEKLPENKKKRLIKAASRATVKKSVNRSLQLNGFIEDLHNYERKHAEILARMDELNRNWEHEKEFAEFID